MARRAIKIPPQAEDFLHFSIIASKTLAYVLQKI